MVVKIFGIASLVLSTFAHAQVVYLSRTTDGTATIAKSAEGWASEEKSNYAKNSIRATIAPKLPSPRNQEKGEPVRRQSVVLFAASWCGYCRKAKAYLAEHQITYTEYDFDTEEGQDALAQMSGGKKIPFLVYGNRHVSGFSEASYDALFASKK